eukprot:TRINITY_DN14513_c0_g1_i5.p1 TRINITY_DN14513_c0_g1~~TRINITY_DN14513_c0_g1_i5.p1  ORF type:complete len:1860 (+),score=520.98 TRINITY_DN14513_c0_g1_i5:189-5582(+)
MAADDQQHVEQWKDTDRKSIFQRARSQRTQTIKQIMTVWEEDGDEYDERLIAVDEMDENAVDVIRNISKDEKGWEKIMVAVHLEHQPVLLGPYFLESCGGEFAVQVQPVGRKRVGIWCLSVSESASLLLSLDQSKTSEEMDLKRQEDPRLHTHLCEEEDDDDVDKCEEEIESRFGLQHEKLQIGSFLWKRRKHETEAEDYHEYSLKYVNSYGLHVLELMGKSKEDAKDSYVGMTADDAFSTVPDIIKTMSKCCSSLPRIEQQVQLIDEKQTKRSYSFVAVHLSETLVAAFFESREEKWFGHRMHHMNLRSLLEDVPFGIVSIERNGLIVDANPATNDFFGLSIVGMSIVNVITGWNMNTWNYAMMKVETGKENNWTSTMRFHDLKGNDAMIHVSLRQEDQMTFTMFINNISQDLQENDKQEMECACRFRRYIESAPIGFIIFSKAGRIEYANATAGKMLQYTPKDFEDIGMKQLFSQELAGDAWEKTKQVFSSEERTLNCVNQRKDGSTFVSYIKAVAFTDSRGLIMFSDISEEMRVKKALEDSERKYRRYIEGAPVAVIVADATHRIVDVNPKATNLLQYSKDEFRQLRLDDLVFKEDRNLFQKHLKELNTHGHASYEIYRVKKGGVGVPVHVDTVAVGENTWIEFISDLRDRIRMQTMLKRSEKKYMSYIEHAPQGVIVVDNDMNVTDINPRGCELFTHTYNEAMELELSELLGGDDVEETISRIQSIRDEKKFYLESKGKRDDISVFPLGIHAIRLDSNRILLFVTDLTIQKTMQRDLIESEKKFRMYFDSAPEALIACDPDLRIVDANTAATRIFQYTREEFLKLRISDLGKDEEINSFESMIHETKETKFMTSEKTQRRKDGSDVPVRAHGVIATDRTSLLVFYSDITQEVKMRQKICESEKKYRSYVENAPECIFVVDFNCKIMDINEAAIRTFQYSKSDLLGMSLHEFIPDDDKRELMIDWRENLMVSKQVTFETRWRIKDGSILEFLVNAVGFSDDRVIGFMVDITNRKQVQKALEESEKRYRTYIEIAPNGIVVVNAQGAILDWNSAACKLCGYSSDEMKTMTICDICVKDDAFVFEELCTRESGIGYEMRIVRKDGRVRIMSFQSVSLSQDTYMVLFADVTEKKLSEQALAESEKRFHDIFRVSADAIVICDTDLIIVGANPSACEVFGRSEEELRSSCILTLMSTISRKSSGTERRERLVDCLRVPYSAFLEITGNRKDGSIIDLDVRANPINFQGELYSLLSIRDVTKAKSAERERRRHLASLQQAEEIANLGYFEKNLLTGDTFWSDGFLRIVGIPASCALRQQMKRKDVQGIDGLIPNVHPDCRETMSGLINDLMVSKHRLKMEFVLQLEDGSLHDCQGTLQRIVQEEDVRGGGDGGSNVVLAIHGVIEDVTKKKEAELALQESEQRFSQFMKNATEGVVIVDSVFRCTEINDVGRNLIGCGRDAIIGYPFDQWFSLQTKSLVLKELRRLKESGSAVIEAELLNAEGEEVPVFLTVITLPSENSMCFICDLTGQKRAEKEKQELQTQLHRSQKMEAIGRLAGGVAHDFNNLLTAIVGSIELAQKRDIADENVHQCLKDIRDASDRAAKLTKQLLMFSRKQEIKPLPSDLNDLVNGMMTILSRTIDERVQITFHPSKKQCCTKADRGQVEQILLNLVVNARDAMPYGGNVEIATKRVTFLQEKSLEYGSSQAIDAGKYSCLIVTDTGTGIEEDVLRKIFEPFFTTKPEGKGTGLGLATVYGRRRRDCDKKSDISSGEKSGIRVIAGDRCRKVFMSYSDRHRNWD